MTDEYNDYKSSEERWKDGEYHDDRSSFIASELRKIDWQLDDGFFDWELGGDGDNGEQLAFQLDTLFEKLDEEGKTLEEAVKEW